MVQSDSLSKTPPLSHTSSTEARGQSIGICKFLNGNWEWNNSLSNSSTLITKNDDTKKKMMEEVSLPRWIVYLIVKLNERYFSWTTFNVRRLYNPSRGRKRRKRACLVEGAGVSSSFSLKWNILFSLEYLLLVIKQAKTCFMWIPSYSKVFSEQYLITKLFISWSPKMSWCERWLEDSWSRWTPLAKEKT